jgi:hypothetical protein
MLRVDYKRETQGNGLQVDGVINIRSGVVGRGLVCNRGGFHHNTPSLVLGLSWVACGAEGYGELVA